MYQDRVSKHILGTNCYEFSVGGSEYEHLTLKKRSPAHLGLSIPLLEDL